MNKAPAATRQEGITTSVPDRDLELYWRDCQKDGEHFLAVYRRVTMNRSFDQQQQALKVEIANHTELAPRLRELIAAADQELLLLDRFSDVQRAEYAALLHYRTGLASLWDIVSPYLFILSSSTGSFSAPDLGSTSPRI